MAFADDLVARAERLLAGTDRRVLIGLAGAPGTGKTTLAEMLVARLGGFPRAAHVPMDGFHFAKAELARLGRSDRMGAPDTFDVDGYAVLLHRIRRGQTVWAPNFERTLEQPLAQAIPVLADTQVVVSEGNYLLLPEAEWRVVRAQFDEVWFCHVNAAERLRRLIARHVAFGKSRAEARAWVLRSDERNAELVASTAHSADLIVEMDALSLG
jgi:pantothenate kinase